MTTLARRHVTELKSFENQEPARSLNAKPFWHAQAIHSHNRRNLRSAPPSRTSLSPRTSPLITTPPLPI
ncbi:Cysteine dioxygenase, partial [Fusarium oxysporum f. sp. albedinis]